MQNKFLIELTEDDFYFKYAKGDSSRNGKEFHLFYEIILFLGGEAEFISETVNLKLTENTLIFIPKETYHQVKILGNPDRYLRCIINFSKANIPTDVEPFSKIGIYDVGENIKHLFDNLISVANGSNNQVGLEVSKSLLDVILYELSSQKERFAERVTLTETAQTAIKFIEENLSQDISVEQIASHCHVSPSTLSHLFKNEMQTSVWRYCLQKKLLSAHGKIKNGTPATTAAIECGFNDYSGFYKQYKKMFGFPPSAKS